jgi:trehalose synthase
LRDRSAHVCPLQDGTVYSARMGHRPFSCSPLEEYEPIVGQMAIDRLRRVASDLEGLSLLELNSSAKGGGVAEMLFSSIPLLDGLGLQIEWKTVSGSRQYFEATKNLHNLLQGKRGVFTPEMEDVYVHSIEQCAIQRCSDGHDVVLVHDPQPFGLGHYLKSDGQSWLWRCHIDIDEETFQRNPRLWDFMARWSGDYDGAIFSAAHYVVSRWPMPKFIIPPFIDPLSEKNRELTDDEVRAVLEKYGIDRQMPIVAQIGRFDPWKGLDRTIESFRLARKSTRCQLVIAGGLADDDPEGERILNRILDSTSADEDMHVLNLPLEDRLTNWREVNALQRAASVIMQPSTREGFGLVITEGLWKGKPVIGADVGAIPLQIRNGVTGFFYGGVGNTAKRLESLLANPAFGRKIGERGREFVRQHFLLPDRVADYLASIRMAHRGALASASCDDCIVSFHPWFKLSKRGRG